MSEPESIVTRGSQAAASRAADDLLPEISARTTPEREGLPRNYRMRADAHYVDQLEASQPVIRMVPVAQIEARDLPPPDRVDGLTKSIAMHGVLHPLLVRKHASRYSLIAGRKRLAGAIAAGLAAVPCLLHEADGAAAAALAEADNLRLPEPQADGNEREGMRPLLQAVASDLGAIRTSTSLLKSARTGGLQQQVGADLVDASAARAAWLVGCLVGTFEDTREVPLAAIIQRVSDGFTAYTGLTGLQLECSVTPSAAGWRLPEDAASAVISGAVFATLAYLEGAARPRIEVHADAPASRQLKIEIVQRSMRVPANIGLLAEQDVVRPSDMIASLALRTARSVAGPLGGTAELTPLPGVGSVLRITFASA